MYFFQARSVASCLRHSVAILALAAAVGSPQNPPPQPNHGQLDPGQTAASKPAQGQPGKVNPNQGDQAQDGSVQSVPGPDDQSGAAVVKPDVIQAQTAPLVFESHGLEYEAITKNGITLMFAQLPARLKEFNIGQVTITNGSLVSWTVRPSDFTFVRQDGTTMSSVSADYVVSELMQRANRDDVIKLALLYENSIYGLSNFRSTNGYEKRRESAMAQFVNRGFKAAAEASAIALVPTKLRSGDSTDGAIFFENRTKEKGLGAGKLIAHACGETFLFDTYAELKKR